MLQSDFGILRLPTAAEEVTGATAWIDFGVNRVMMVIAVVLVVAFLKELFNIYPSIRGCLTRARGNLEIEHSLSTARSRNFCARICALPLLLVADRYSLYGASFIPPVEDPAGRMLAVAAVILAFIVLRRILYLLIFHFFPPGLDGEARKALGKSIYNYFLYFILLMLVSLGVLSVFHASEGAIRTVILVEMAVILCVALFRQSQILSQSCSGLGTFLYLCGLEILPAAALVVSGMLL